jgi:hypothetical protein
MASPVNAVLCALLATAFWSLLGYALTRHLLPRTLAIGAAPVVGWAVHSAATLPIFFLIGFSPLAVVAIAALCVAVSVATLKLAANTGAEAAPAIPWWAFVAAAVLALAPAVAILPKITPGAVHLADPIFDHSKIAIIDAMTRQGLPPVDPVFGAAGPHDGFFYYYLWHYSAAALALPLHVSGWEADIGLTWFTAFASLSLLMGLAVWLSKRSAAAFWVVALAAAASLRAVLSWIFGPYALEPFLAPPTGFAGWLFQAAPDPGPGRGRRLRELDLCRRHHLCDRGTGGGAVAACRNRAGAALAVLCRHGGRRRVGGLPRRAVFEQSAHGGRRARRQ